MLDSSGLYLATKKIGKNNPKGGSIIMTAVAAPALLISKVLDTARELSARLFGTEWIQPPLPKPVMSAEAAVYPKLLKIYKELNRQKNRRLPTTKGS